MGKLCSVRSWAKIADEGVDLKEWKRRQCKFATWACSNWKKSRSRQDVGSLMCQQRRGRLTDNMEGKMEIRFKLKEVVHTLLNSTFGLLMDAELDGIFVTLQL